MSETALKLLEQIRALPAEDQDLIAEELADESDDYDPLEDPEFRAELDRRIEAVGNGTAVLLTWEKAQKRIDAELARRRAARGES